MEIILGILFSCYYVFSVLAMTAFISETYKDMKWYQIIFALFIIIVLSPLSLPIILGLKVGIWLSKD